MKNFLQHKTEVIENFCNSFKANAWKKIWGIDLNCNTKNTELTWLAYTLLKYQQLSDCCSQCTESHEPKDCVVLQYATSNPSAKFPFIALSCNNFALTCTRDYKGDFNLTDFNNDFYI